MGIILIQRRTENNQYVGACHVMFAASHDNSISPHAATHAENSHRHLIVFRNHALGSGSTHDGNTVLMRERLDGVRGTRPDGAIAGDHLVAIAKTTEAAGGMSDTATPEDYAKAMSKTPGSAAPPGSDSGKAVLPAKYAQTATSDLKRTVVAGEENVFNFDLE